MDVTTGAGGRRSPRGAAPLSQVLQQLLGSLHRGVKATTGFIDGVRADPMQLAQRPVDDVHHLARRARVVPAAGESLTEGLGKIEAWTDAVVSAARVG